MTGINNPNVVLIKVDENSYESTVSQILTTAGNASPNLIAVELNPILEENKGFLSSLWSVIMSLPAFALSSAVLCLISFHLITIDEQRQEFAILRATGGKPKTILAIIAIQSLIILFSSFAIGTSIGTIITIFILTENPVLSAYTILAISGWLLAAITIMFLLSLYLATRFSKKSLVEIMS
jgi:ABC-type antimicrobial peptide transport system permease subunit